VCAPLAAITSPHSFKRARADRPNTNNRNPSGRHATELDSGCAHSWGNAGNYHPPTPLQERSSRPLPPPEEKQEEEKKAPPAEPWALLCLAFFGGGGALAALGAHTLPNLFAHNHFTPTEPAMRRLIQRAATRRAFPRRQLLVVS
jgi:hypothetical protein